MNARDISLAKADLKDKKVSNYIAEKRRQDNRKGQKEMRWIDENVGGEETGG